MHNYRSNESLVSCKNVCIFVAVPFEFTLEGSKPKIINTSDAYFLSIFKNRLESILRRYENQAT